MENHPHKNISAKKAAIRCILRRSKEISLFAAFDDYLIKHNLDTEQFNNLDDILNEPTFKIFTL